MKHIRFSRLLCVVLLFALTACQAPAASTPTVVPATSAPAANPLGEHVVAEWKIYLPEGISFGFDSVWISGHRDPNNTIRIDPATNKIIATIQDTGKRAHSTLAVSDAVWVDGEFDDTAKIDPKTNSIVARVPGGHTALAYGFGSIWSTTRKDQLDRIDPVTVKIITSIELGNGYVDNNNGVMVTASAVWVFHIDEGELIKIDPTTNSIVFRKPFDKILKEARAQTSVPAGKSTDFMWVALPDPGNPRSCGLLRIDPNTGAGLTFMAVGNDCNPVAVTENAVWLSGNVQIDRFNVAANQIDATYQLQPGITNIAVGLGSVWALSEGLGVVWRLDIAP